MQKSRILLSRVVEQYNFIHENTEQSEYDIISDQVKMIDTDVTILIEKFTWLDFGKKKKQWIFFT